MEYTDLIKERLDNAPQEIKEYLARSSWEAITLPLIQQNSLSAEQATSINNEIIFVLLGLELKQDFEKNTRENAKLPGILATNLNKEVQQKVFRPLSAFLPTESEDEDLLNNSKNLLEDAKGNSDNVLPPLVDHTKEIPLTNNPLEKPAQREEVPKMSLQEKLMSQIATPPQGNKGAQIITKAYKEQDPYREPLN